MKHLFFNFYKYEGMNARHVIRLPHFRMFVEGREYNKFPFVNIWVRRMLERR